MIETLLSLFGSILISSLVVLYLQLILSFSQIRQDQQDQFAILQLRQYLALSHSIQVDSTSISYIYNYGEFTISQDKNRLVKRDGYEIIMENIDDVTFFKKEDKVYISYTKNKKEYTFQIN